MKKQEVLKKLTDLYDICDDQSEHADDGWRNIALAISTAEDVVQKEIAWDNQYPQSADHGSSSLIDSLEHWAKCFRDGTVSDSNAEDIAYLLEDRAHDLRLTVHGQPKMWADDEPETADHGSDK
jgi:hypothetical protein